MSEHDLYHAAGYQPPQNDPRNQQSQTQPAAPQFRPQVASTPTGYRQADSSQNQNTPMQQEYYGNGPSSGYQVQGAPAQSYFPQGQSGDEQMGGLASQMGNMTVGGDVGSVGRPTKKKNRHAYHNLDQSGGSSQAFSAAPQSQVNSSPYQNFDQSQSQIMGHSYTGQPITPAMNQFPAQAGTQFSPAIQPSTPGFGVPTPAYGSPNPSIPTPSGPGVSAQGKVDPEQIPSVPRSRDLAAEYYLDHIYPTMEQHLPPPSAIPFVAHDQGNSSPKYARLTLNNIPSTSDALSATALPLGLVLQPLAPVQEGENQIPVLDFGDTGPPRCRRCRTYINPFMTFRSGGNKLVCNMCTFPNEVQPEYFAPTDPSGVRVDRPERPELTNGTVEYMVPKEYWAKEPVGLRWLFLIDVSQEAVTKGFLDAFCEGILGSLYGNHEQGRNDETSNGNQAESRSIPSGSKVGFVTYDKAIHFYNCHVSL